MAGQGRQEAARSGDTLPGNDVEPVELRLRDDASSYGRWRNVGVVIGHNPPSARSVVNYRALVEDLLVEHPQGVGLLTIVRRASTPDPSAREALVDMFRAMWPRLLGVGFVVEAQGFAAATQRAIGSALVRVMGVNGRVLIDARIEHVVPWLAARVLADGRPTAQSAFGLALLSSTRSFATAELDAVAKPRPASVSTSSKDK